MAEVTITVNDANEKPVTVATVSGDWSGGASGVSSCTTDEMGQCTITNHRIRNSEDEAIFMVHNVTHAALIYTSAENRDPDEDSDGAAIKVNRP